METSTLFKFLQIVIAILPILFLIGIVVFIKSMSNHKNDHSNINNALKDISEKLENLKK